MKTLSRLILVSSIVCAALVNPGLAQLVTYQTVSTWSGSVITLNGQNDPTPPLNGSYLAQTFSNVLAISSMTYNFFSASGTSGAGQVQATFGQWNSATSQFVGSTVDFGVINIPSSSSWTSTLTVGATTYSTFTSTLSFASLYVTDPTKTYSILFQNTSNGATGYGLGLNNGNPFIYGGSTDGFGSNSVKDYAFQQIVVVPNDGSHTLPVPEASTVASLFAVALVAGLVALRLRQRREADFELTVA
jgi:hypothetical protein